MDIVTLAAVTGNISTIAYAIATIGPALAMGLIASKAIENTARQPEVGGRLMMLMLLGIAFVEVMALLSFALAFVK